MKVIVNLKTPKMASVETSDTCVRSMQNIERFITSNRFEQSSIAELQVRLKHLQANHERFVKNQEELMQNSHGDDREEQLLEMDLFEDHYMDACAKILARIEEIKSNSEQPVTNEVNEITTEEQAGRYVRAPPRWDESINNESEIHFESEVNDEPPQSESTTIQNQAQTTVLEQLQPVFMHLKGKVENTWGDFDGNAEKWQGFHDRFKAAVHDNTQIAPAFKIQHLLKALKGKAKEDLGEWPQTEAGYNELWERMQELYAQEYYTAHQLLNKFNKLPVLEKASRQALQKMSNTTHEVIRQLRTLSYPVEQYDLFFVWGIHSRLDIESGKAWELERDSEKPLVSDMLAFLDRQARAAPSSSSFEQKRQSDFRKRSFQENKSDAKNDTKRFKPNSTSTSKCKVCKTDVHPVHKCETFRKLSLSERKKSARENELCYNCLHPSHSSKDCKSAGCKRCENKKHNSLLCPENPYNQSVNAVQLRANWKKKSKQPKKEAASS